MAGDRRENTLAAHLAGPPIEPWRLDLIARYSASVARHAPRMEARYPGHDVEPLMMSALYLAALTWNPDGTAGFHRWYRSKLMGQMAQVRNLMRRRARGLLSTVAGPKCPGRPVRFEAFPDDLADPRSLHDSPEAPAPSRVELPPLSFDGETRTLKEWAEVRGLRYKTLLHRYHAGLEPAAILSRARLRPSG